MKVPKGIIPKIDDKYLWWPGKDEGQPAPPIVWFNESDEETAIKTTLSENSKQDLKK